MVFRQIAFGSEELVAARELRNLVLRIPVGLSLYDEDLNLESRQMHFGLFQDGGEMVACVIAVPMSSNEAKIRQMAVGFAHQGKGYGQRVLQSLEDHLLQGGFTQFCLHARTSAVGFYEKMGYEKIGPEFVEIGLPHVRMEKEGHKLE